MIINRHRRKFGPDISEWLPRIKARHRADIGFFQRRNDMPQIIRTHADIAVADDQQFVFSVRNHVDEIGYFRIRATVTGIGNDLDVCGGKCTPKLLDDLQRRIVIRFRSKHDLHRALIVLTKKTSEIFFQSGLGQMQGF